jgi:hypothetical protein
MKIHVTFVCDDELWAELRKRAIDERKTASELLEEMITKRIGNKR